MSNYMFINTFNVIAIGVILVSTYKKSELHDYHATHSFFYKSLFKLNANCNSKV